MYSEMKRNELVAVALEIIDSVDGRKDLQKQTLGGPGCLLERLFPDAPERGFFDGETGLYAPSYYELAGEAGLSPVAVCRPNDAFVRGLIGLATLREAIARLAE